MNLRSIVAVLSGFTLLLGGCSTPSLNPLATGQTMVGDQGLIGSWSEDHGNETYVVAPTGEDKIYRLLVVPHDQDSKSIEAELRVVKLGEDRFADISPTEKQRSEINKSSGSLFVPAYAIVKIKRTDDTLVVNQLSSDWLKDSLKNGSQVLTHALVDDDVVITAPTSELQAFVSRIAGIEKAWDKPTTLLRLKAAGTKSEKQ